MNYEECRRNILPALQWAAEDMRESRGRRWRWHECVGQRAYWASRQCATVPSSAPGADTQEWRVISVGVVMPRRDPELAAIALGETARLIDGSCISGDQAGCVDHGVPGWGVMSATVYCSRREIGMDVMYVYAAVVGQRPTIEGGSAT